MTTLILVTLGVLLAAASAFMMMYFGGDAFSEASDKAEAARLISEGTQVDHAYDLFRAQEGRRPGNGTGVDTAALQDLLDKDYLAEAPVGMASGWEIDHDRGVARSKLGLATDEEAQRICVAARKQLGLPDPENIKRCNDANLSGAEPCCIMTDV